MPFPYVTTEEVEDRLGRGLIARAVDANGDGDPDPDVMAAVIKDACSRVRSRLMVTIRQAGADEIDAAVDAPDEIRRLSMMAVRLELIQVAPAVFPDQNWTELEKSLNRQLDDWAAGRADLGVETPANEPNRAGISLAVAGSGRGW